VATRRIYPAGPETATQRSCERRRARGLCGPRFGHQIESKASGRCTGGISRTVGREKARAAAAGRRGVMVTVTAKSSGDATSASAQSRAVGSGRVDDVDVGRAHGRNTPAACRMPLSRWPACPVRRSAACVRPAARDGPRPLVCGVPNDLASEKFGMPVEREWPLAARCIPFRVRGSAAQRSVADWRIGSFTL
jgi:hypothetical protein